MVKVINLKLNEINELIRLTADKMKLPPSMVEKDFWVSYMLEYLLIVLSIDIYWNLKVEPVYPRDII